MSYKSPIISARVGAYTRTNNFLAALQAEFQSATLEELSRVLEIAQNDLSCACELCEAARLGGVTLGAYLAGLEQEGKR